MSWWSVAEWVLLAPALWCTLAQWLGYDGDRVTASLLAVYPFVMLPGLGGGLIAVLRDDRPGYFAALAVTCTFGMISNTTPSRQPSRAPSVDTNNVRIVVANLLASNPHPADAAAAVATEVEESAAQVLVLVEPTPRMIGELELRGGGMQHGLEVLAEDPSGIALRTTVPLRGEVLTVETQAWVDAVAQFSGRSVRLIAAHPFPPTEGATAWRRQLEWLAGELGDGESAVVVAGDFNACRWHPSFRRLLRATGLRSAHEAVGSTWSASWPADRLRPFVRLDHALVRGVHAVKVRDFDIPGSDHRGFVVTLDAGPAPRR